MKVGNQTAHAIDRHVGLTPEQLQRRMRDASPPSASSFYDLTSAQSYVQTAIDRQTTQIAQKILADVNGQYVFTVDFSPAVTGVTVDSPSGAASPYTM